MTALCLTARIKGDEVARRVCRPRLRNLFGVLAKPVRVAQHGDPSTRIPPFIERLWMPAYAVCLHTVARRKQKSIWTSVDGWTGQFSLLERVEELALHELEEESFSPNLNEPQAVELARKGLLLFILHQRGQINKPLIEGVEDVRLYYLPVWVYYYRRYGAYLDLKVIDGYTGKSAGAKMRVAVINALVAARKSVRDASV